MNSNATVSQRFRITFTLWLGNTSVYVVKLIILERFCPKACLTSDISLRVQCYSDFLINAHTQLGRHTHQQRPSLNSTHPSQPHIVSLGSLWLLGLFFFFFLRDQTSALRQTLMWEHVCAHMDSCRPAGPSCSLGVSAPERARYSESILWWSSHPPVVSGPVEKTSWENPSAKGRGQFAVWSRETLLFR